jgi:transposase-like protein
MDGVSQEPGRLLHPGNAVLRRAIRENLVSFPSQIPVFSRQTLPDMQWKAVLLYFVRGWPLCDIADRFGVKSHRIAKAVDEWATRAIALGYIQVIDAEQFAEWSSAEVDAEGEADAAPALTLEQSQQRELSLEARRLSRSRDIEDCVVNSGEWRPNRSLQPPNGELVTALDLAIRRCEDRPGMFFGQTATLLRDIRSAIEAGEGLRLTPSISWISHVTQLNAGPQAPAEELLYAFKS